MSFNAKFGKNLKQKVESHYHQPSWNCHLTVVEGFGCPNDSRSYVAGGYMSLAGHPSQIGPRWGAKQSAVQRSPWLKRRTRTCVPGLERYRDPALELGLGKGSIGKCLVAGPAPMGSVHTWAPSPAGGAMEVRCSGDQVTVEGGGLGDPIPSYPNWPLGHGTSPLWWGRNLSLCERLRDTG